MTQHLSITLTGAMMAVSAMLSAQSKPLPAEFTQWLKSNGMEHATVTLEVAQLPKAGASGAPKTIYAYDNQRLVAPASVMKLLTTAAAIDICGAKTTVPTEVGYSGKIDDQGTLHGDIIIRGHGNAMLASSRSIHPREAFNQRLVASLRTAGIRRVEGRIVGDGSILTGVPVSTEWTWEDIGNYYAPALSGLNYADNSYTIVLNTMRKNVRPSVEKIEPDVDGLIIDNQLQPLDCSFDSAYIFGAPNQFVRTLYGAVPHKQPQFRIKGDVPDPAQFCASQVRKALMSSGVKVEGPAVSGTQKIEHLLYIHQSETLGYVAQQTNVYSVNMFAEMLLRQIALKVGDGSEISGINAVLNYWASKGVDKSTVRMYDGCGLAPSDRLTANTVIKVLHEMRADSAFISSLAVAGESGTVYSFLKGTRLDGKAHIKTGTLKNVIAYSGYIEGSDKRTYAVSLFVNNHTCSSVLVRKNIQKMFLLLIP